MTDTELMDLEESQFPPLAKYAFAEAYRETLASGRSVLGLFFTLNLVRRPQTLETSAFAAFTRFRPVQELT